MKERDRKVTINWFERVRTAICYRLKITAKSISYCQFRLDSVTATLQLPFKLLTVTGIWMPIEWTCMQQKISWLFFSFVCIGLVLIQLGSQIGWLLGARNWAQFNERLFLIPTGVSSIHKIFIFISHRQQLIQLDKMFFEKYCIPRNIEELRIQRKYDEIIRVATLSCAVLVNITMMNLVSLPLVTKHENRTLPMRVWLPYRIDSDVSYWFSYAHQTLGILLVGTGAVGSTLMINGFIYQVCAQFDILSHRFQQLPLIVKKFQEIRKSQDIIYRYEKRAIKQHVQHHRYIFRLADTINELFQSIIFQQFCLSAIVVSVSVYQLSTRPVRDMEFIMVFFYLICVLTEFLVYCWCGNELMLESLNFRNSIFSMDWSNLSINSSKDLILIILRTSRPIFMYCGHFIVLSLESYISILKISYSVFNVLTRSSE